MKSEANSSANPNLVIMAPDDSGVWHLVREVKKEGIASLAVLSWCGKPCKYIAQLPDKYLNHVCVVCLQALEKQLQK